MKLAKTFPILFLIATPFLTQSAFAAQVMSNVTLNKVTVFLKGAELQGTSTVAIPEGESEILLTQVANSINANSINVGVGSNAMILSTSLMNNYLIKKAESDSLKSLTQALKEFEEERDMLGIMLAAIDEEIALLQGNRIDGLTKSNSSLSDAKQVINFVKDNLIIALKEKRGIQLQIDELNKRISQHKSQIDLENNSSTTSQNVIKVKVLAKEAMDLALNVSYVTAQAGWTPTYDVRVSDINSPLVLTYKANVYQYSGLAWKGVDFSLSTANPSEGIVAPIPSPWHVYLNDGKYSSYDGRSKNAPVFEASSIASLSRVAGEKELFQDYVVTSNNGINTQFNVKLPYTIYGHSINNILTLKAKEVEADYRYIATPKLDSNAFLQAQITDWDKLALLPGKSTVFFAGNYIGEGFITTQGIKDKLNISLGRDKAIIISRNQDVNETSKPSFFGNDVSQKFAYTIDVRNTKELPIDITIYDQLPVIQNKAIVMEDMKYNEAEYNKETGLLTWDISLKAKEVKQMPFSFKLKYPQNKSNHIIGL